MNEKDKKNTWQIGKSNFKRLMKTLNKIKILNTKEGILSIWEFRNS